MANLIRASALAIVLTGCGLTTPVASLPNNKDKFTLVAEVKGHFSAIEGGAVDLTPAPNTAQILMFVSQTCSVCRKETASLVADRQTRGIPKNVVFYSVVLGGVLQDAVDWRGGLSVDWQVGIDPGDNLFRSYCPEGQTPCIFVTNASGTTFKLIGAHSLAEWEQFTGPWKF
jgi:hypothetical protein